MVPHCQQMKHKYDESKTANSKSISSFATEMASFVRLCACACAWGSIIFLVNIWKVWFSHNLSMAYLSWIWELIRMQSFILFEFCISITSMVMHLPIRNMGRHLYTFRISTSQNAFHFPMNPIGWSVGFFSIPPLAFGIPFWWCNVCVSNAHTQTHTHA